MSKSAYKQSQKSIVTTHSRGNKEEEKAKYLQCKAKMLFKLNINST